VFVVATYLFIFISSVSEIQGVRLLAVATITIGKTDQTDLIKTG